VYSPGYSPVLPYVSIFSGYSAISVKIVGLPSSSTWESPNRAVYCPVIIPAICVARRVWWANGLTTTGGATIEVGIYADSGYGPGVKLVSGSAVQGTASQVQFVDVTDLTLAPALYWIAIRGSSSTNTTIMDSPITGAFEAAFRFQETSANPLPSTATPVESTSTHLWLCGFATTASP
jgi:hypothetical protein